MKRTNLVLLVLGALLAPATYAAGAPDDASRWASVVANVGDWNVVQFLLPKGIFFRIASDSANSGLRPWEQYISFDFRPDHKCAQPLMVLAHHEASYVAAFDGGFLPISYKIPGQPESDDLATTEMLRGDSYSYAQLHMAADKLLLAHDKGFLVMWIPGSGDGTIRRSANVYFSLSGFTGAYQKAMSMCIDNR